MGDLCTSVPVIERECNNPMVGWSGATSVRYTPLIEVSACNVGTEMKGVL